MPRSGPQPSVPAAWVWHGGRVSFTIPWLGAAEASSAASRCDVVPTDELCRGVCPRRTIRRRPAVALAHHGCPFWPAGRRGRRAPPREGRRSPVLGLAFSLARVRWGEARGASQWAGVAAAGSCRYGGCELIVPSLGWRVVSAVSWSTATVEQRQRGEVKRPRLLGATDARVRAASGARASWCLGGGERRRSCAHRRGLARPRRSPWSDTRLRVSTRGHGLASCGHPAELHEPDGTLAGVAVDASAARAAVYDR